MVFALAIGWRIGRNAILWERYEEVKYTLDIFFAALLLYVFAFEGGKLSRLFHSQTLVVLGNISMYIYIFHFPIVSLLCTQVLGSQSYGSILQPQESTLVIALDIICIAAITYFAYQFDKKWKTKSNYK